MCSFCEAIRDRIRGQLFTEISEQNIPSSQINVDNEIDERMYNFAVEILNFMNQKKSKTS